MEQYGFLPILHACYKGVYRSTGENILSLIQWFMVSNQFRIKNNGKETQLLSFQRNASGHTIIEYEKPGLQVNYVCFVDGNMFVINSTTFGNESIEVGIAEFVHSDKNLQNVRKFMTLIESKMPRDPIRTHTHTINQSVNPPHSQYQCRDFDYYQGAPPSQQRASYSQSTTDSRDAKSTIYSEPAQSDIYCNIDQGRTLQTS